MTIEEVRTLIYIIGLLFAIGFFNAFDNDTKPFVIAFLIIIWPISLVLVLGMTVGTLAKWVMDN